MSTCFGSVAYARFAPRPGESGVTRHAHAWRETNTLSQKECGSVPAMGRGIAERADALVAEEVVAGEDVVDLEAVRAGIALADVALQEAVVVDDTGALAVVEQADALGPAARLAGGRWCHPPRTPGGSGQTAGMTLIRNQYTT